MHITELLLTAPLFSHDFLTLAAGGAPLTEPTGPATNGDVIALVVYILLALICSFLLLNRRSSAPEHHAFLHREHEEHAPSGEAAQIDQDR